MKTLTQILTTIVLGMAAINLQAEEWKNFSNFNQINHITVSGNQVWVAARGGLVMYDQATGSKTFYTRAEGLPSLEVERVLVAPSGDIWIGTYDNGLAVKDINSNWSYYTFPEPKTLLYEMKLQGNGDMWCATSEGLYKLHNGVFTAFLNSGQSLNATNTWDIDLFSDGRILCGGFEPFIFNPTTNDTTFLNTTLFAYSKSTVYIQDDSTFYFASDHGTLGKFVNGYEIDTFHFQDRTLDIKEIDGKLLLLNEDKNIYQYNGNAWAATGFAFGLLNTFSNGSSGDIWAGGINADYGKLYHQINPTQTETIDLRRTDAAGNWIVAMSPASDGNVFISHSKGLQKYDVATKAVLESYTLPNNISVLDAIEHNGKLYVGTASQFLYVYSSGQWSQLGVGALPNGSVRDLSVDWEGNIWMTGTNYVAKYDGSQFTLFSHNTDADIPDNLYSRDIYCDSTNQSVWVASYAGISRYHNGDWVLLTDSNTVGIAQYYDVIETIEEDKYRNIWFGTVYGALIKFDGINFSTMFLPITAGNQTVTDIEFTEDKMYVSDNLHGVYIYEAGEWDSLTMNNSKISDNITYALHIDRDGSLWMGHLSFGVDVYNKDGLNPTSIKNTETMSVKVYPNPSTGVFKVSTHAGENGKVAIIDLKGELIEETILMDGEATIDLSGKPTGLYFGVINGELKTQTIRLLLQ
ncbi:MAG: T9SS type A sorting domain-containing protein [Chitinophagales bacterium]|nr:T9SS type A sorting domain-containing protein [Chitinophagales bacterium]